MLPHWTQNDLLVNGKQLHYYRTGHGDKQSLVLVHGFSDNGLCWAPVARDLESDYDVIMPDMRGHGLSSRVQLGETMDMAADVAELIRTLKLERPIVCGHSMGAGVTYQLGARFPELVRALVLEDPAFALPPSVEVLTSDQPMENPVVKWAKSLPGKTLEALLVEYREDHPTWPEALLRPMCESKKQLDPMVIEILSDRMKFERSNWQTAIQNIPHPILLFTANPDLGAIVTPEVAAKVHELNPKVIIVNIPDVGHLIRFDKYSVFMETLRAFLRQVPS